ncbi:MAG: hypothetical protein Q8R92_04000 [Deltaproteobacteria bacterium]|nr:hypothetical protein [Deltaproteobacteria bacterium]
MSLLRLAAIALLAYLGVRLLRHLLRLGPPKPDPMKRARTIEGADMVRDPACGIYTPRDTAVEARVKGETVYFCSEACREAHASGKTTSR